MKKLALSIKNPYSYLVCTGAKWVENRTWKTDYRGRIYIHSSGEYKCDMIPLKKVVPELTLSEFLTARQKYNLAGDELKEALQRDFDDVHKDLLSFVSAYDRLIRHYEGFYGCDLSKLEKSDYEKVFKEKGYCFDNFRIIGHVDLVDIVENADSDWAEDKLYNWIFDNPVLYDSPVVNVKGKLRLFDVSHIDMPDD